MCFLAMIAYFWPGPGLVECASSSDACWVHWFVVNTMFPPSGCHFSSSHIWPVFRLVETQLGDL